MADQNHGPCRFATKDGGELAIEADGTLRFSNREGGLEIGADGVRIWASDHVLAIASDRVTLGPVVSDI